jgi:3-dehydroquinate synthase
MQQLILEDYTISVGDISRALPSFLSARAYSSLLILMDENTRRDCYPLVEPLLPGDVLRAVIEIPAGEIYKTVGTCERIWDAMLHAGADRNALLLNLGGGVIGDMGGFCAATFKRGIDFIQIPTTLLSQVDASIGGKLGIDFGGVKNSIGVFRNPQAVLIDPRFLQTLPQRELYSGFAEVIKHALIADAGHWEAVQAGDPGALAGDTQTILRSLGVKQAIVQADPFEKGLRKALNFGHTVGHAVEAWSLQTARPLLHGETVALGMIVEAHLSNQLSGLSENDLKRISEYLLHTYTLYALPTDSFPDFMSRMQNDKKNAGGRINCTLLEAPGRAIIDQYVSPENLWESLLYFNDCVTRLR